MTQFQHLCPLAIGQPEEPSPELISAVAHAMNDADLVALANQIADAMVDLIQLASAQSFIQLTVARCISTAELPASALERALSNAQSELENAKAELERSDRRLAEHRQSSLQA